MADKDKKPGSEQGDPSPKPVESPSTTPDEGGSGGDTEIDKPEPDEVGGEDTEGG